MQDKETREHYESKHKKFLFHCGIDQNDVWKLQSLDDFINCIKYQSEDQCYELIIKYANIGWTLKALSKSADKVRCKKDNLIVVSDCVSLYEAIQRLAYRVYRDWGGNGLNDNVISINEYVEIAQRRTEGP